MSVCSPESVRIFPFSILTAVWILSELKKLSIVCLSGRTRTGQNCPEFHCPCPPTSGFVPLSRSCFAQWTLDFDQRLSTFDVISAQYSFRSYHINLFHALHFLYKVNFPTSVNIPNYNGSFPTSFILSKLSQNFQTSSVTFHLKPELSNFMSDFPT